MEETDPEVNVSLRALEGILLIACKLAEMAVKTSCSNTPASSVPDQGRRRMAERHSNYAKESELKK